LLRHRIRSPRCFRALCVAAVAVWIVKAALSNTPIAVKTLFCILVSIADGLLKDNRTRFVRLAARASIKRKHLARLVRFHRTKNGTRNLSNTSQAPHDEVRSPRATGSSDDRTKLGQTSGSAVVRFAHLSEVSPSMSHVRFRGNSGYRTCPINGWSRPRRCRRLVRKKRDSTLGQNIIGDIEAPGR
jgi:hypothetical protein